MFNIYTQLLAILNMYNYNNGKDCFRQSVNTIYCVDKQIAMHYL